jgi:hypothetical protein
MTDIEIFNNEGGLEKIDNVLSAFKNKGMSQFECTKFLVRTLGMSLTEADRLVLNSHVWVENKDIIVDFREGLAEYLSNLTESDLEKLSKE